ncbi:MAG: hypothetical protein OK422_06270 [Thaumarchaeota archaeon]|nr:hypothetical protein [Nitrososphaerota archaeon]
MKTTSVAIGGVAGVLAVLAMLVAYPAIAATQVPSLQLANRQTTNLNSAVTFTAGQTITLTSSAGGYRVIGDPAQNGTASGTLTLKVDGVLKGGYVVTVSGGSLTIGTNIFTVTGGSAEIGHYGRFMVGQGTASNSALFLFQERSLGKFGITSYGVLTLDFSNGATEYGVRLLVTAATA